jgi:hypothetical protein
MDIFLSPIQFLQGSTYLSNKDIPVPQPLPWDPTLQAWLDLYSCTSCWLMGTWKIFPPPQGQCDELEQGPGFLDHTQLIVALVILF